jgi:hypothetical protein
MAEYREDAEELLAAVQRVEPNVQASLQKQFLRRRWYVRVERADGEVVDYEDINHYWLERGLRVMFGGGGQ